MIKSRRKATKEDGDRGCVNCVHLKYGRYHGIMIARCGIDGMTFETDNDYGLVQVTCDKCKVKGDKPRE